MEQDDIMIIKVFLGILIILFLIMLVLFATRAPPAEQESTVVITNSFNTYSYSYEDDYINRDDYDSDYVKDNRNYLRYGSWSKHKTTQGMFNDIDEYIVYVRNKEDVGGYFTVRFYFEDDYGEPDTEMMTKYIGAQDSAKFVYKDIYQGGHDYSSWRHKVTSESARDSYYWE